MKFYKKRDTSLFQYLKASYFLRPLTESLPVWLSTCTWVSLPGCFFLFLGWGWQIPTAAPRNAPSRPGSWKLCPRGKQGLGHWLHSDLESTQISWWPGYIFDHLNQKLWAWDPRLSLKKKNSRVSNEKPRSRAIRPQRKTSPSSGTQRHVQFDSMQSS